MPRVRAVVLRVKDRPLFESLKLRGRENEIIKQVLNDIRNGPVRASNLEAKYGISIYNLLEKLVNSGMVEKSEEGYILSLKFSSFLRKFAEEWEIFVKEGEPEETEGYEII